MDSGAVNRYPKPKIRPHYCQRSWQPTIPINLTFSDTLVLGDFPLNSEFLATFFGFPVNQWLVFTLPFVFGLDYHSDVFNFTDAVSMSLT